MAEVGFAVVYPNQGIKVGLLNISEAKIPTMRIRQLCSIVFRIN